MEPSTIICTYLDHNAGAPLRPEARDAILATLGSGNASSVHAVGRNARARIEAARADVAALVGASPKNVFFTSGGSEANATILAPLKGKDGGEGDIARLLVGATEHPSVLAGGRFPAEAISEVPVDIHGVVELGALAEMLSGCAERGERAMVSIMLANNETGAIQPVREIAALSREHGALVHTDAAQATGRMPIDMALLGVDFMTLSGHKLGGPQGAGAIVRRSEELDFLPLVTGGGQEGRRRAGTENVAAIAGFGAAARAAGRDLARIGDWTAWRDRLTHALSGLAGTTIFSGSVERLPQTICLGVEGVNAETLVIGLDLEGVAVSSGSACSSGKVGPSHVLLAMGVAPERARSAIRISFGWDTTEKDLDRFQTAFRSVIRRITAAKGERAA